MTPKQSKDNPFDILDRRVEWVEFEYQAGRGSKHQLVDYAKRFRLMRDIAATGPLTSQAVVNAMTYLLDMGGECETERTSR
jgi:hypothetical protein